MRSYGKKSLVTEELVRVGVEGVRNVGRQGGTVLDETPVESTKAARTFVSALKKVKLLAGDVTGYRVDESDRTDGLDRLVDVAETLDAELPEDVALERFLEPLAERYGIQAVYLLGDGPRARKPAITHRGDDLVAQGIGRPAAEGMIEPGRLYDEARWYVDALDDVLEAADGTAEEGRETVDLGGCVDAALGDIPDEVYEDVREALAGVTVDAGSDTGREEALTVVNRGLDTVGYRLSRVSEVGDRWVMQDGVESGGYLCVLSDYDAPPEEGAVYLARKGKSVAGGKVEYSAVAAYEDIEPFLACVRTQLE